MEEKIEDSNNAVIDECEAFHQDDNFSNFRNYISECDNPGFFQKHGCLCLKANLGFEDPESEQTKTNAFFDMMKSVPYNRKHRKVVGVVS